MCERESGSVLPAAARAPVHSQRPSISAPWVRVERKSYDTVSSDGCVEVGTK